MLVIYLLTLLAILIIAFGTTEAFSDVSWECGGDTKGNWAPKQDNICLSSDGANCLWGKGLKSCQDKLNKASSYSKSLKLDSVYSWEKPPKSNFVCGGDYKGNWAPKNGNTCMSTDGKNCMWSKSLGECLNVISSTDPSKLSPGLTLESIGRWETPKFPELKCKGDSKGNWTPTADAMCISKNGKDCVRLNNLKDCEKTSKNVNYSLLKNPVKLGNITSFIDPPKTKFPNTIGSLDLTSKCVGLAENSTTLTLQDCSAETSTFIIIKFQDGSVAFKNKDTNSYIGRYGRIWNWEQDYKVDANGKFKIIGNKIVWVSDNTQCLGFINETNNGALVLVPCDDFTKYNNFILPETSVNATSASVTSTSASVTSTSAPVTSTSASVTSTSASIQSNVNWNCSTNNNGKNWTPLKGDVCMSKDASACLWKNNIKDCANLIKTVDPKLIRPATVKGNWSSPPSSSPVSNFNLTLKYSTNFSDFKENWKGNCKYFPDLMFGVRDPGNVEVNSNGLKLKITLNDGINCAGNTKKPKWKSGGVTSNNKFGYGYYESKYKYAHASGINNAFWLTSDIDPSIPGDHSDEIDINEGHFWNRIMSTIHQWSPHSVSAASGRQTITGENFTTKPAIFGLLYTPNFLAWYLNDELYFYFDNTDPKTRIYKKMNVRFDTAIAVFADPSNYISTNKVPDQNKIANDARLNGTSMDVSFFKFYELSI